MNEIAVVTCFLEHCGKVLLLRRSQWVGSYRGRWAGVSGYLEGEPDEQALTEIAEETGLSAEDVEMLCRGEPLRVTDPALDTAWTVYPYLFRVMSPQNIRIDWEHRGMRWVSPSEIPHYSTVPMLTETWARVSA